MPPAFNLSQDQTLQFNLCYFFPFLESVLSNRSLTQITDRLLLAKHPIYYFCEHLIFFKLNQFTEVTWPRSLSSAHIYWLLIVKDLYSVLPTWLSIHPEMLPTVRCFSVSLQIVLFVSTREMRLCGISFNSSTPLLFPPNLWCLIRLSRLLRFPAHCFLPFTPLLPARFNGRRIIASLAPLWQGFCLRMLEPRILCSSWANI